MNTLDLRQCRAVLDHEVFSGEFSLRPLEPDHDLDVVHSWMNDPEVARFWRKPWPRVHIAAYLRRQHRSAHSEPYLGLLNGVAMSYWELYRADLDPLAQHYPARQHDAGVHMLLGPAEYRGRRLAVDLLRAVSTWQLGADPHAARVVAEPDVDNVRMIRALEHAGFRRIADMNLPDKRAALMVCDRDAL
ncbi:GNAT family N-acetyltransferase [Mycobacterium gastri]|uniref:Lysine N-acyltransferase MbtK n=1 Tax=Mycobacterium gastri TaxID=1777 RepID=A0A1X1V9J7_MYCGS|nr:GNAT family N-acetyltransferase [Mycobacterium gastri]ETW24255.1 N-acetyltransferase GCN5 [Mycobacterium gastri 'Wayne']ORV65744.1 GCN5 family acetyltransferase [Mycobacterium gastri]